MKYQEMKVKISDVPVSCISTCARVGGVEESYQHAMHWMNLLFDVSCTIVRGCGCGWFV